MPNPLKRLMMRILPERFELSSFKVHPAIPHIWNDLQNGQIDTLIELYTGLDAANKTLVLEAITNIISEDSYFDKWQKHERCDKEIALSRATLLVKRAWFYRGAGRASEVNDDAFERMFDLLDISIELLKPLLEHPFLGQEACAQAITVLMGLNENWDDINYVHETMRTNTGWHLRGELNFLLVSCEKWLGSHDAMFAHARNTIDQARHAPHMSALIAAAHFERYIYFERFDGNAAAAKAYKENKDVLAEIEFHAKHVLAVTDQETAEHIYAHNIFAGTFSAFGRFDLARPHFDAIGQRTTAYPWTYFWEEEVQAFYNKARSA